jgi:YbbR domain-containing protein
MRKKLLSNWGWKIISLLLAFGLWVVVMYEENPPDEATFDNIEVELLNTQLLTADNKVYSILDSSDVVRRVTVEATRDVLSDIKASDIRATADLENLTATDTVAIDFSVPSFGIGSKDISGSIKMVKLSIEDRKQKYLSVKVNTVGEVADGYELEAATLTKNNRINISGAASIVDQASYASATVDVSDASANLSMELDIDIYDAEGNKMDTSALDMSATSVQASVTIFSTKMVPIHYSITGEPAEGYLRAGEAVCTPTEIMIAGMPSTLNRITDVTIPEGLIDITDQAATYNFEGNIIDYLPDGVKLAKDSTNEKVVITIPIEKEQTRNMSIPLDNIQILHTPEGFTSQLVEDGTNVYSLSVSGLAEALNQLSPSLITGTVDVEEWMTDNEIVQLKAGNYALPITIDLSDGVKISEPMSIDVSFSEVEEP